MKFTSFTDISLLVILELNISLNKCRGRGTYEKMISKTEVFDFVSAERSPPWSAKILMHSREPANAALCNAVLPALSGRFTPIPMFSWLNNRDKILLKPFPAASWIGVWPQAPTFRIAPAFRSMSVAW